MDAGLARLTDEFIRSTFEAHPTIAAHLGLHDYDGRVGHYGPDGVAARVRRLREFRRRLDAVDRTSLGRLAAFDLGIVEAAVDGELFLFEDLREPVRNPLLYIGPLDVSYYVKRTYAPLPVRARALATHLREYPRVLGEAQEQLTEPVARPIFTTALEMFEGQVAFLRSDLPQALRDLDGSMRREVDEATDAAVEALGAFVTFFRETVGPRITEAFAIGEDRFRRMLVTNERVDLPLDDLLRRGEDELARLRDDLARTAARIDPDAPPTQVARALGRDHPPADRLVPEARSLLAGLRSFVREREIVTVPEADAVVEETPPFLRWAFAMMDTAGPFEKVARESFYYVTLPLTTWTREEQEQWLTKFDHATLAVVSIHEAYPGHFVHFMAAHHAPTEAAKIFSTYSFFEGWAHYAEEMMIAEQGYGGGDPRLRLAYLSEALLRVVRYLCAIRMHARGMTVDEAAARFVEDACMEPLPARKEAERGCHDPGYLNYTLGKMMVRKLREDVRRAQGASFSLREFHDRLIHLGAPPLPVARHMLLERDDGLAL